MKSPILAVATREARSSYLRVHALSLSVCAFVCQTLYLFPNYTRPRNPAYRELHCPAVVDIC